MFRGTPEIKLSLKGAENQAELYALLSEAKQTFTAAIRATTGTPTRREADAGIAIFTSVLNTLRFSPITDNLPTLDEIAFDGRENDAILPPPVLATLGYFRSRCDFVRLTSLDFPRLHPFDDASLSYSRTLLWGNPALQEFTLDIIKIFTGETSRFASLPYPRIRAYQLCRFAQMLLGKELARIGPPTHPKIFTAN